VSDWLYGANILSIARNWSGRLPVIIVYDTSQDIPSMNQPFFVPCRPGQRKAMTQALMWKEVVVILGILFENAAKVVFIQDQDRVETLFTNRSYPPFSICIRSGGSIWGVKYLNAF
jgi:hypothetical protein